MREQQRANEQAAKARAQRAAVRKQEEAAAKAKAEEEQAKEDAKSPEQKAREKAEREAKAAATAKRVKEQEESAKKQREEEDKAEKVRQEEASKAWDKRMAEQKAQAEVELKERTRVFMNCTTQPTNVQIADCLLDLDKFERGKYVHREALKAMGLVGGDAVPSASRAVLMAWRLHEDLDNAKKDADSFTGFSKDDYNMMADSLADGQFVVRDVQEATRRCSGTGVEVMVGMCVKKVCTSGFVNKLKMHHDEVVETRTTPPTGMRRKLVYAALEGAIAMGDMSRVSDLVLLRHGMEYEYTARSRYGEPPRRMFSGKDGFLKTVKAKKLNICEEMYQAVIQNYDGDDASPCHACINVAFTELGEDCAYCDKGGRNGHSCFKAGFHFGLPRCKVMGHHWMDKVEECPVPEPDADSAESESAE
jgi:hypothetical protein